MSIPNPIQAINEKNASALRRYIMEYSIIALAISVIALFYLYIDLHTTFRDYITVQNVEHIRVIEKNNAIVEKNTETIKEVKQFLIITNQKNEKD